MTRRPSAAVAANTSCSTNRRRSSSSRQRVKTSSNWSTTSSRRSSSGRSTSIRSASRCSASAPPSRSRSSGPATSSLPPAAARCVASEVSGAAPGFITRTLQPAEPGSAPPRSAGMIPARASEDLPLPDAPTTARKRPAFSRSIARWVSASRPKKSSASASSNGRKPRYGAGPSVSEAGLGPADGSPRIALTSGWRSISPPRRSTHVRVVRNGESRPGSNGSGSPGRSTRKTRKTGSEAPRTSATRYSSRDQSPRSPGPTHTAHAPAASIPSASSSSHARPAVRFQRSNQTFRRASSSACATAWTAERSGLEYDRKTS